MELLWSLSPSSILRNDASSSICFDDAFAVSFNEYKDFLKSQKKEKKLPVYLLPERRVFAFGNKIIKAKAESSRHIVCIENEKVIWEVKHWAYLYTDIIAKNGCVIFGTDGMGSRLYCVEIETGKVLSELKTHFSTFYHFYDFNWHNENVVTYGKGTLIVTNPFTGEIIDEYKIPAKFFYRSFLKVIKGFAYAQVLTNSNVPTVMCFRLK